MFDINEDIFNSFHFNAENEFQTFDDFANYFDDLNNCFLQDFSNENKDVVPKKPKKNEKTVFLLDRKNWQNIEDPNLRRKIRNRYSAERCRKKKLEQTQEAIAEKEKAEKRVKLLEEEIQKLRNILGEIADDIPTNL